MTRRGRRRLNSAAAFLLAMLLPAALAAAEFRDFKGHGGPVKSVRLSADGERLLTSSFDYSVGLWPMPGGAPRWMEGHRAAVNAAIFLPGGGAATAGDDFDVILWDLEAVAPRQVLKGHQGKVVALAAAPDGRLASAAWDGSIRIWDTATGAALAEITGHQGAVNDVAWSADGTRLYSAGYDGTVVEWETETFTQTRRLAAHGFGVNVLALDEAAGWLAYGALDGGTRVLDLASGEELADLTLDRRPILAIARSADGGLLAVGDGEGYIMVVETGRWRIVHDFRAAVNGPVWALSFTAEGDGLIAGGIADTAYLWPLEGAGEAPRMAEAPRAFHTDPASVPNGERQFLRKCSVCHTLNGDGARRAGPPLEGLFGRRAGAVPGYSYSPAMQGLDLTWSAETIDRLFDEGPDHYIPGTKMPMQRIVSADDRADLIDYLRRATAAN